VFRISAGSALSAGLLLAAIVSVAGAQTPDSTAVRVDSVFAEFNRTDAPGCVCGVMRDGEMMFAKGYGMANLEFDVPLSPRSVIYIASTSKQFTAASIAVLALQDRIDLDADIHTYLPDMGALGYRVSVRNLVHHTSGIRDHFGLLGLAGWTGRDYFSNERVYELLKQQRALNFEPGSRYLYSNSNYLLLAEIVERVSGQSLREFARANLFEPLGMENTHFDDDYYQIVKQRASSYGPRRDGGYERYLKSFDGYGDGNLLTTIGDLLKWDENFYDPKVGGQAFLDLILTPGTLNTGDTLNYAFGLGHGSYRGLPTVSHGGGFKGFRTQLLRFPTEHFSVAVLCNVTTANPTALAERVTDIYLADALAPTSAGAPTTPEPSIELSESELERFAGHYWDPLQRIARQIAVTDGQLVYRRGPGNESPLAALDARRFVMLDVPVTVEVAFYGDDAHLMTVTVDGGSPSEYERYEPASPTESELDAYLGTYDSDEGLAPLRVTRVGQVLNVHVQRQEPLALRPLMKDRFAFGWGSIAFDRTSGRVTGLAIDASRILGVRYRKRN
jgi:CubicO group peptidase (beta-lactamase class C family)